MTIRKYNSKGISHHLLFPILAILIVAGVGGLVMQRSSSAASKTGWTKLGTIKVIESTNENSYMLVDAKACKIKSASNYKVKVKLTKQPVVHGNYKQSVDPPVFHLGVLGSNGVSSTVASSTSPNATLASKKAYPSSRVFLIYGEINSGTQSTGGFRHKIGTLLECK